MIANLLDKQEKLYLVPSTKKENELLAGIIPVSYTHLTLPTT